MDGAFTPTVIKSYPIPMLNTSTSDSSFVAAAGGTPSLSGGSLSPQTISNTPIKSLPIAVDVVSVSLDTQQRQILGTYTFGRVGNLQVGAYEHGVSGQINISPNGITAENVNGETTFTLDGATGDATFKGTIQAGSVISANLTLGGSADGNGILQIEDATGHVIVQDDHLGSHYYNSSGDEMTRIDTNGVTLFDTTSLQLFASGAGNYGYFGPDGASSNVLLQTAIGVGLKFSVNGDATFQMGAFAQGTFNINGTFKVNGSTKTAIVPTSEGYKALYTNESPEVWFMDFVKQGHHLDPLFEEVTEGETMVIPAMDGWWQVWRRRKGFGKTRFESKTREEFVANNEFWQH